MSGNFEGVEIAIPFPDPPLADGAVALRPWRPEDAAVKASWGRDHAIVWWTDVPADYTEAAALAWAAEVEEHRLQGRGVALAIVDAASGAVLGSCDLRRPDPADPTLGEIGYLLSEHARGRGHATRAVMLQVQWAFQSLGMRRVQALVEPGNSPSSAVLERVGFRNEGLLRNYRPGADGRGDRFMFSVTPGELLAPSSH